MVIPQIGVANSSIEEALRWLRNNNGYTIKHSERVADISLSFGIEIGLPFTTLRKLYWGALLHDIGKIAVDPDILNKPAALTPEEYKHVMSHTLAGYNIVKGAVPKIAAEMVYHHHDRFDGRGLDQKIAGEDIPLCARILKLADAYDAMISDRPYRAAMSPDEALSEIRRCSGTEFDPALAGVFIEMYNNILKEQRG